MKFSIPAILILLFSVSSAQATCSQNDSRLTNCDTPAGTAAYTHIEIVRDNCENRATIFQPSATGEPVPIMTVSVAPLLEGKPTSGLPDEFKGSKFDLTRTDGTAVPTDGGFKVHLEADTGSKKLSEDLKCSL